MNILFLTTGRMENIEQHSLYPDLLRELRNNGHSVYTVSSFEKRVGRETEYIEESGVHTLRVKIGNLTKTNTIEKGISTLLIGGQFLKAINKYLSEIKFDLILYSTPPITLANVIEHVKKRDNAKTYLLLKDIFPQNAVDIGMMSKSGIKGLMYKYFRKKEKKLYALSDKIGCMSKANVEFVLRHNPQISPEIVEIFPNCIEPRDMTVTESERFALREKYGIPQDKKVFVYGGNLGKPQGIPFLIECLKTQKNNDKAFFLVVGDGAEYGKLETFFENESASNMKLMKRLPKEDYDRMVASCDVGMIFLDYRFTIPNFPSRLLSYMQAKIPVLCVTDVNTDVGEVAEKGGFGWKCESNDSNKFSKLVDEICVSDLDSMGEVAFDYLMENYNVKSHFEKLL